MPDRKNIYHIKSSFVDVIVGIILVCSFVLVFYRYIQSNLFTKHSNNLNNALDCLSIWSTQSEALLYSHAPLAGVMLIISIFVYFNNKKNNLSLTTLILSLLFSLWVTSSLIIWSPDISHKLYFLAQSQIDLYIILFLAYLFFFSYEYLNRSKIKWKTKLFILLPVFPLALYLVPNFTESINQENCTIIKNDAYLVTALILKIFYTLLIAAFLIRKYIKENGSRLEIPIIGVALLMCFYNLVISDLLFKVNKDFSFYLYGILPLIIFVTLFTTLIIKYTDFKVSITGANVIVISLVTFVAIKVFHFTTYADLAIDLTGTFLAIVFSYMLMQSIKREHNQKEEIEHLANKLGTANHKLKKLDKMKSEFVSIASHQLRSPLTAIRGYTELILEGAYGKTNRKLTEVLKKINESGYNMAVSIEDYLNVSRIEAGNMNYDISNFSLAELTEQVVDDLRRVAIRRGLALTYKNNLSKNDVVEADKGKTKQILHNLIDNAIKYTPNGSIEVTIHNDEEKIFIDITDTGIGIASDVLDDIFEKFERAKNSDEENMDGSGLGLYIAKKMSQKMGGDVYAYSAGEGKGSTFTLELPLLIR